MGSILIPDHIQTYMPIVILFYGTYILKTRIPSSCGSCFENKHICVFTSVGS